MERTLAMMKEEYGVLQRKYGLPGFDEMNADFYIEKVAETETDFLLREIRKFIADRFFNYLRFVESLLNPVNVPMFVYSMIKTLGEKDKEKLTEIYKKLAKHELYLIELDIKYFEEKEAEFLKYSYEIWQEIKGEFSEIIEIAKKNWDAKVEEGKGGYLG